MTKEADGWTYDAAARERVRKALADVDARQARFPVCPCGQRTSNPRGICGKRTPEHDRIVAEARWST
jgi:hypothetical protein